MYLVITGQPTPGALCIVHSQDLTPGRAGEMTSLSWPRNASVERKRSGRLCLGYCLCYQATDKQNKIGGWTFGSVKNEKKRSKSFETHPEYSCD